MSDNSSGEQEDERLQTTKKRKKTGRVSEVSKQMKLQSHETGEPCNCNRLKCFERLTADQRKGILANFNSLESHDAQNLYLTGLITAVSVAKRRAKSSDPGTSHVATYLYRVRVKVNDELSDFPVCAKAFISLHGIRRSKLHYLQKELVSTGEAAKDKRGIHTSVHRKLKPEIENAVMEHIASFKSRSSHYALKDTRRQYLPDELNVKKMHNMFLQDKKPITVSYEKYREIFNTKFNLSFGYPRMDTCSHCDEMKVKISSCTEPGEKRKLQLEDVIHKKKAQVFYDRKRLTRKASKSDSSLLAIAMDYQKNISIPNISTNDVYYKRQLSMFSFNIHVLSSKDSYFYTYPEIEAKKGSDEVSSFLFHFFTQYVSQNIKHVHIFCDSCGGQNKNFNLFRVLYYIVHVAKLFESITMTFPVRGHSYLENDKNMGLINQKARLEMPHDWYELLKISRQNPKPFQVIEVTNDMVKDWTNFTKNKFVKKCPFPIQKLKEINITISEPRYIQYREHYNAEWGQQMVVPARTQFSQLSHGEFLLPDKAYDTLIPIKKEKYQDIQALGKFCSQAAQEYYKNLPKL